MSHPALVEWMVDNIYFLLLRLSIWWSYWWETDCKCCWLYATLTHMLWYWLLFIYKYRKLHYIYIYKYTHTRIKEITWIRISLLPSLFFCLLFLFIFISLSLSTLPSHLSLPLFSLLPFLTLSHFLRCLYWCHNHLLDIVIKSATTIGAQYLHFFFFPLFLFLDKFLVGVYTHTTFNGCLERHYVHKFTKDVHWVYTS